MLVIQDRMEWYLQETELIFGIPDAKCIWMAQRPTRHCIVQVS